MKLSFLCPRESWDDSYESRLVMSGRDHVDVFSLNDIFNVVRNARKYLDDSYFHHWGCVDVYYEGTFLLSIDLRRKEAQFLDKIASTDNEAELIALIYDAVNDVCNTFSYLPVPTL